MNAIPASTTGVFGGLDFASCHRFPATGNGTLDYCPANIFDREETVDCEAFVYARKESVVYEVSVSYL